MAFAANLEDIVSQAFAELGSSVRIADYREETQAGASARRAMSIALPALLAEHPWNFALARVDLDTESIEDGAAAEAGADRERRRQYRYRSRLPSDCLRWLPPREDSPLFIDAVQESDFLLHNCDGEITIRYIRDLQPVELGQAAPHFIAALVMKIALALSEEVNPGENSRYDRLEAMCRDKLDMARRADGQATGWREQKPRIYKSSIAQSMHRYGVGGSPSASDFARVGLTLIRG